jgi:hypothetical protein
VLSRQLSSGDPLTANEFDLVIPVNTEDPNAFANLTVAMKFER